MSSWRRFFGLGVGVLSALACLLWLSWSSLNFARPPHGPASISTECLAPWVRRVGPFGSLDFVCTRCSSVGGLRNESAGRIGNGYTRSEAKPVQPVLSDQPTWQEETWLEQMLRNYAAGLRPGSLVVYSILDRNYLYLVPRWLQRVRSFTNASILLGAMDGDVMRYCANEITTTMDVCCFRINRTRTGGPECTNRLCALDLVAWGKFRGTQQLLRAGMTVLFSEFDVVWLQNVADAMTGAVTVPDVWQYREEWLANDLHGVTAPFPAPADSDVVVSGHWNHPRVNIGLYLARPTDAGVFFFDTLVALYVAMSAEVWDQVLFDLLLQNTDLGVVSSVHRPQPVAFGLGRLLRWHKLDPKVFAGDERFSHYDVQRLYSAHTLGHENKRERLLTLYDRGPEFV